jgi:hypothetical protein
MVTSLPLREERKNSKKGKILVAVAISVLLMKKFQFLKAYNLLTSKIAKIAQLLLKSVKMSRCFSFLSNTP